MARARITIPDTLRPVDDAVDVAWDRLRGNPVADRIFYTASEAANFSMIWHALALARSVGARDPRILLRTSAALGIESALVNGPIKSLFLRERPVVEASSRPRRLRQPKTSSFPSGHASAAVVAAAFLNERSGSTLGKMLVRVLAAVVSTSRIHVRIHHATDVAGGALVGWVLAKMTRPFLDRVIG